MKGEEERIQIKVDKETYKMLEFGAEHEGTTIEEFTDKLLRETKQRIEQQEREQNLMDIPVNEQTDKLLKRLAEDMGLTKRQAMELCLVNFFDGKAGYFEDLIKLSERVDPKVLAAFHKGKTKEVTIRIPAFLHRMLEWENYFGWTKEQFYVNAVKAMIHNELGELPIDQVQALRDKYGLDDQLKIYLDDKAGVTEDERQPNIKEIEYEQVTVKVPKRIMDMLRACEGVMGHSVEEYLEYNIVNMVHGDMDDPALNLMMDRKEFVDKYGLNPIFDAILGMTI